MIEIIPRPIKKTFIWQRILFYFSVFLLIAVTASYFALSFFIKKSEQSKKILEEKIENARTPQMISIEKEVLDYQRKIEKVFPLLSQHIMNTKFFEFLESKTHPKVFFSQVSLDSKSAIVTLGGNTESFVTLEQQLIIFRKEPRIEGITLGNFSISKEGEVNFELTLSLDPSIFNFETSK